MSFIIEVEGISGAGKTTLVPYIVDYIKKKKFSCFSFYEPGTTELGKKLRKLALNVKDSTNFNDTLTHLLLFLTNRSDIYASHQEEIDNNDFVVVDRYYGSTQVYQIMSRKSLVERGILSNVLDTTMRAIMLRPSPTDSTFLLNASPKIAFDRVKQRINKLDDAPKRYRPNVRKDFIEFNTARRTNFLDYFYTLEQCPVNVVLNADQDLEHVVTEMEHRMNKLLEYAVKTRQA